MDWPWSHCSDFEGLDTLLNTEMEIRSASGVNLAHLDGRTWIVCHRQGHISFHQQELLDEPAATGACLHDLYTILTTLLDDG